MSCATPRPTFAGIIRRTGPVDRSPTPRRSNREQPTNHSPRTVAATYFDSWKARDFAAFRSSLADDVVFAGPKGQIDNADDCTRAVEHLAEMMTDIVIHKVFVHGPDVLAWYDMRTAPTSPMPVANRRHIQDGKITRIRVGLDPRPLLS